MPYNRTNITTISDDDCILLKFKGFIPWNNPQNLVSAETEAKVERVKSAIVLPIFFLIGGPANVLNMAVFYKQGLKERTNLCLFALSLADELYLMYCMVFNGERLFQLADSERYGELFRAMVNHSVVGLFSLSRISQFISAVISTERCLCVLWPLKFQTLLRTKTMGIFILSSSFIIAVVFFIFPATKYRLVCAEDLTSNMTLQVWTGSDFYYAHREIWDFMDSIAFGVVLPGGVTLVVIVTTVITVIKLRQVVAWRTETTTSGNISARDLAVTKMLIYNSVLFLVCMAPMSLFRAVLMFFPKLGARNVYHNTHFTMLWVCEMVSYFNSSCNVFVYFSMGSRYRQTVRVLFSVGSEGGDGKKSKGVVKSSVALVD